MQFLGLVIAAAFLLGWIIPLTVGIIQLRRHHGPVGVVLTVVGGLWALPALAAGVTAAALYFGFWQDFVVHTFNPARQSGPHATITVPCQGQGELEYRWQGKHYRSESANGQFIVPAAPLSLSRFTALSGAGPHAWQARSTLYENGQLTLVANERRQLAVGPPYAAQVKVREAAGKANLSLEIKDAGGHSASISDADRKHPPRFEVLDRAGKVVWQGKFEYG